MSWVQLALAVLGIARQLLDWAAKRAALQEAQDQLVAKQALEILALTKSGQELRARLAALDDAEAAQLWERMIG